MAAMKAMNARNTPTRIMIVAVPRRHPRAARRLTPGSIASDRKNDTSNRMNSAERLLHTDRVTIVTMKPSQKMAVAFHTHRGMSSGGNHGWDSDITAERSYRPHREGWRPSPHEASPSRRRGPANRPSRAVPSPARPPEVLPEHPAR